VLVPDVPVCPFPSSGLVVPVVLTPLGLLAPDVPAPVVLLEPVVLPERVPVRLVRVNCVLRRGVEAAAGVQGT